MIFVKIGRMFIEHSSDFYYSCFIERGLPHAGYKDTENPGGTAGEEKSKGV